ncbi:trypsin-like peptidase domain-containing protein [Spirillospora sp. CA-253888]
MNGMAWRARIDRPGASAPVPLGGGFLIDEHHVVTCAHVVGAHEELPMALPAKPDWRGSAKVVARGGWARQGDPGDVAVLRLDSPAPVTPCEFVPPGSVGGGELRALGFPPGHERDGTHVTLGTGTDRLLGREWLEVDVRRGHLRRIDRGFSGAAVYETATGRVVGMLTDAVLGGQESGTTGRMVPLEVLRRYWEPLDDLLDLPWLPAPARRELRELLDGRATAEPPAAIFRLAFPRFLRPPESFRSLWDAVRYVCEEVPGGGLDRFLGLVETFLDEPGGLAAWRRRRLRPAAAAAPVPQTSIIVRVEATTRGPYELTLSPLLDGTPGRAAARLEVTAAGLRAAVEGALPELVRSMLGRDWMIEFVMPEGLLNEPFDEWSFHEPGARRPQPLRSLPLVVRHVERLHPLLVADHTRRRLALLRERGRTAAREVGCGPRVGYEDFRDELDADEETSALVCACFPDGERLAAALDVGIPVMLWRRPVCDHGGDDCPGTRFVADLTAALAGMHPDLLPRHVTMLRKQARTCGAGHHGHQVTLFWDDPERAPDPPLRSPG